MIRSVDAGFGYLESFTNYEVQPGLTRAWRLERMEELCGVAGNPERQFRAVHLAGSKGKGSTATYLAALLEATGDTTGLYTSPHIEDYRERITLAGRFLKEEEYLRGLRWIESTVRGLGEKGLAGGELPTTFELLTLLAFRLFKGLTWGVLETGMGGRLDATNVVTPEATAITPIELEHTEYLGDTIGEIAGEKAGIIKPGVPLFTAPLHPEAEAVIKARTGTLGAPYFPYREIIEDEHVEVTRAGTRVEAKVQGEAVSFNLRLLGERQARNALLALAVARTLRPDLTTTQAAEALSQVRLPGRMELLPGSPALIIDGAHTPESISSLAKTLESLYSPPWTLIFGSVQGKRHREMASILIPRISEVIILRPGTFRPSDLESLATPFREAGIPCRLEEEPEEALRLALEVADPEGCVVAAGSFFLAGAVRRAARELGIWSEPTGKRADDE